VERVKPNGMGAVHHPGSKTSPDWTCVDRCWWRDLSRGEREHMASAVIRQPTHGARLSVGRMVPWELL
jgi:hypothetical protein